MFFGLAHAAHFAHTLFMTTPNATHLADEIRSVWTDTAAQIELELSKLVQAYDAIGLDPAPEVPDPGKLARIKTICKLLAAEL